MVCGQQRLPLCLLARSACAHADKRASRQRNEKVKSNIYLPALWSYIMLLIEVPQIDQLPIITDRYSAVDNDDDPLCVPPILFFFFHKPQVCFFKTSFVGLLVSDVGGQLSPRLFSKKKKNKPPGWAAFTQNCRCDVSRRGCVVVVKGVGSHTVGR